MIVISDTSCIGYLIIIDKLFLLRENFFEIIVPQILHKEILQLYKKYDLSKYLGSEWISSIAITNNKLYTDLLKQVDAGESEAIVLSKRN